MQAECSRAPAPLPASATGRLRGPRGWTGRSGDLKVVALIPGPRGLDVNVSLKEILNLKAGEVVV